jgi:hypothetical protein
VCVRTGSWLWVSCGTSALAVRPSDGPPAADAAPASNALQPLCAEHLLRSSSRMNNAIVESTRGACQCRALLQALAVPWASSLQVAVIGHKSLARVIGSSHCHAAPPR